VARVSIAPDAAEISHDAVSRSLDVTARIDGRSAAAVSRDVTTRLRRMDFPYEYRAEVVGDAVSRAQNRQWILLSGFVVVVLGYLLLQAATGSWRGAAVLLVAVPFAAVGGLLAAQLTGGVLSGGVLAALFSAMALALRQVLVLVRRAQVLRDENSAPAEAMRRSVRENAVPVVTVALAAAALFIPAALIGGAGMELLRPFAITMLAALVTVVTVVLFVVPGLYPVLAGLQLSESSVDETDDSRARHAARPGSSRPGAVLPAPRSESLPKEKEEER
jgi:multidrug efflux pump subunit AcrB